MAVKLGGSPGTTTPAVHQWRFEEGSGSTVANTSKPATGWRPNWQYYSPITITNSGSSNLTDYQILVATDTQALISAGKMRSDCGDIRFGDSSGRDLPHWLESDCNTASTKIWVKVPTLPGSVSSNIYMYYGNPSASSASNGTNTFDQFDTTAVQKQNVGITEIGTPHTATSITTYRIQSDIAIQNGPSSMNIYYQINSGGWVSFGSLTTSAYAACTQWHTVNTTQSVNTNDVIYWAIAVSNNAACSKNRIIRKYAESEPTATVGSEQSTKLAEMKLRLNEGTGSTAYDSTFQNRDCTISGASWTTGIIGKGLAFDGDDYVSCGNIGNVQSLSFWLAPYNLTQKVLDLDGGTNYIELVSGKIDLQGSGWSSPVLYINGSKVGLDSNLQSVSTIRAYEWYHIEIVNGADISATAANFGKVGANYFAGLMDEIVSYDYARSSSDVLVDYNAGFGIRFK
ncbi:MAG: hypothetical protein COT33_00345 [Candidatus Nealsonbacteria bacterium CG08_land_8_20_14_0_20_38_20]|uniref:DUF2341 domain-containing protein n=1 Tax=Candidatus Nealsonbacteria bacterium CG08_land_8_20_14_0_20_38_20 TaxID=1974705 RepID=A0A2H0YPS1_9BACT|nr:MAG: hypothetical protein COT33_00345 [Candidatus Nealsonbacteria bacterium CG08_land_8_20_14_0_20_38_20]